MDGGPTTAPAAGGDRHATVAATVIGTIVDVVGEELVEEVGIGLDATFAEDIELESMEVMEIAERLIATYGERVDFIGWFAEMELEDLVEMTVGRVVDFIVASLQE
jgi:acyl carrier protein